jgi:uncharacterized membrane protein
MNSTHLHLMITHLPIFGAVMGALVLIHGIWSKSNQTKIAAYNLFILSAIGAGIAYATGEGAEETVENIQGVATSLIDQHEDMAKIALISFIILGVISLAGNFFTIKKDKISHTLTFIILFLSIISFGIVARTGYLGGQIRHIEISSNNSKYQNENGNEVKEEND